MARNTPRQPAKTPPEADPRLKFDVSDDQREEALRLHLLVKRAEQAYNDYIIDLARELKVGEGLGKVNVTFDVLTGRFTVAATG